MEKICKILYQLIELNYPKAIKIPSFQLVYKSCYLGKLFSHKELRRKNYIKLFPSSLMNIFKYPVNEPCKQKQDPVCYACLTEVYLTKRSKSSQY